jgi:hypothetical protein
MCQHCGMKFLVGDFPQRINEIGIGVKPLWVHLYCMSSYEQGVK